MTWTSYPGIGLFIDQPWERFAVIDDEDLLEVPYRDRKIRPDGMVIEITTRATNGWAKYRRVGRDPLAKRSVWELIEGDYRPLPELGSAQP